MRFSFHSGNWTLLAAVAGTLVLSACAATTVTPGVAQVRPAFVSVRLTGPLTGHFTSCTSKNEDSTTSAVGSLFATDLVGPVVDGSGIQIGTADFSVVSGGPLIPGRYVLKTDVKPPTGFRAVGTLRIRPAAGTKLPVVTLGQRYEGSPDAVFLTDSGSIIVGTDGTAAVAADLTDLNATQQVANHPIVAGSLRCGSG